MSGGGIGLSPGRTDILDILDLKTVDFSQCARIKYYGYAKDDGCDHGGGQNADIGDSSCSSCLSVVNTVAPCEIDSVLPSDSAVMSTPNSAGSKYKGDKFSVGGDCLSDEPSARAERVSLDDGDDDNAIVDFDYADGFERANSHFGGRDGTRAIKRASSYFGDDGDGGDSGGYCYGYCGVDYGRSGDQIPDLGGWGGSSYTYDIIGYNVADSFMANTQQLHALAVANLGEASWTCDLSERSSSACVEFSDTIYDAVRTVTCTGETQLAPPVHQFEFLYTEANVAFGRLEFTHISQGLGAHSHDFEFRPGSDDAVGANTSNDDNGKVITGNTPFSDACIGSNGFVTFEGGELDSSDNLKDHVACKRISATWWWQVPQYGYDGKDSASYFQAVLFFAAGVADLTCADVVSLSPGSFPFLGTMASDLSARSSEPYYDHTAASCAADDAAVRPESDSIDYAGGGFDLENPQLTMFTGAVDEVWDGGVVDVSDIVSAHTVKLQNGFKTLGASGFCLDGDTDAATNYAESLWDRFTTPRISPLFDGLWAGDQGGVFVDDVEGHSVAMWWWEVQHDSDHCGASDIQASSARGLFSLVFCLPSGALSCVCTV